MVLHSIAFGTAIGATVIVVVTIVLYVLYRAVDGSRMDESEQEVSRRRAILGWVSLVAIAIVGMLWWFVSLQPHEPVEPWIAIPAGIVLPTLLVYGIIIAWSLFDNESSSDTITEQ